MGKFCAAYGCSNLSTKSTTKEKGISFFKFPLKNKKILNEWMKRIRRENFTPNAHSTLCSENFLESDFNYQNFTNKRLLKKDAVPSIFSFSAPSKRKRTSYQFQ